MYRTATMSPYLSTSDVSSPLVTDGEIPALYQESLKNGQASSVPAPNGTAHEVKADASDDVADQDQPVPYYDQYALKPRKLRIITIGAGFSGLLIAHKFQHRFPELQEFVDHSIYEARSDIGGTWLVNTYPGVQCDVPSHIYVSQLRASSHVQTYHLASAKTKERHFHSTQTRTGRDFMRVGLIFMLTSNAP